MKVAIVHDFLNKFGGAERVLKSFSTLFPDAPIFTLLHDPEVTKGWIKEDMIQTSFLQQYPEFLKKRPKFLLPLYPVAVEKLDFSNFDLVISSSSAFAKGIITRSNTKHICYCHSPMRYIWDSFYSYTKNQEISSIFKPFLHLYLNYLRIWDKASADRVDLFLANSENVQNRIKKYYRKDSTVVYPPVEIESFHPKKENANFFLIVSRLEPYKNIETAVRAFNLLPNRHLVIIGSGSEENKLKKIAGKNIEFLGHENDEVTREYFENCRAFLATATDEDFGITPVEAMASGKPVLALRAGGYLETVIEGVTGEFYNQNHPKELIDGLIKLLENEPNYDYLRIRKHAEKFSSVVFEEKIANILDQLF